MPARRKDDPLDLVPIRLPRSVLFAMKAEANERGVSLSDIVRSRIADDKVKPLGNPTPRKRPRAAPSLASSGDPDLLRHLAAIGSNLNQVARAVHQGALNATPIEVLQVLGRLHVIEHEVRALNRKPASPEQCSAHQISQSRYR